MAVNIYHTINSGLYFANKKTGILVDGLHADTQGAFSNTPDNVFEKLKTKTYPFVRLDGLLFTHWHSDHYDDNLVTQLMNLPHPPWLHGPGRTLGISCSPLDYEKTFYHLRMPTAEIVAINTQHDGLQHKHVPHHSYVLHLDEEWLFVAGDGCIDGIDMSLFKNEIGAPYITAGFFNLYHFTRTNMLNFIRKLNCRRIYLYHLPFPEDDFYNFRLLANRVIQKLPKDISVSIIEPMSWVNGE